MTIQAAIQILQSESGKALVPVSVAVTVTHVDTLEKIINEAESNMHLQIHVLGKMFSEPARPGKPSEVYPGKMLSAAVDAAPMWSRRSSQKTAR